MHHQSARGWAVERDPLKTIEESSRGSFRPPRGVEHLLLRRTVVGIEVDHACHGCHSHRIEMNRARRRNVAPLGGQTHGRRPAPHRRARQQRRGRRPLRGAGIARNQQTEVSSRDLVCEITPLPQRIGTDRDIAFESRHPGDHRAAGPHPHPRRRRERGSVSPRAAAARSATPPPHSTPPAAVASPPPPPVRAVRQTRGRVDGAGWPPVMRRARCHALPETAYRA